MIWFWTFILYSFIGFLLEVAYAAATGGRPGRKGFLLLPLCPVYGVGACLILMLPQWADDLPVLLFLLGAATATGVEYLAAVYHEKVLGVTFWSYDGLPGNLSGRVCLPFSLAWGALSLILVYLCHPFFAPWLAAIPAPVSWAALTTTLADGALTAALLRRSGTTDCLRRH